MAGFDLFVSPGLGAGDAAAARLRYEGDDEKDDYLDASRIRSVAGDLIRQHHLHIASEDDEGQGGPGGLDLESEDGEPPVDVRVDGSGVGVSVFGGRDTEARRRCVRLWARQAALVSRPPAGPPPPSRRDRPVDQKPISPT